jgi:transcriptional regulator with XRE-family HTH domain
MATKIESFYETLGSNIQSARENRKMTQAQLGLALVPPSTRASIANIEHGKQRVLAHTLIQLTNALEIEIEKLLPSEGPPARPTLSDVEDELRRKLNLGGLQLKKLAGATRPTAPKDRKTI